jgi:hypothetical protein
MVSGAEWRLRQFAGLKVRRQTAELLENNRTQVLILDDFIR